MCIFKKKQKNTFNQDALVTTLKEKARKLERIGDKLQLEANDDGQISQRKKEAVKWKEKCVKLLLECTDTVSIMLPPRNRNQADVHERRIKEILDEMEEALLDCGLLFHYIEEKIYPLTQKLANEIEQYILV